MGRADVGASRIHRPRCQTAVGAHQVRGGARRWLMPAVMSCSAPAPRDPSKSLAYQSLPILNALAATDPAGPCAVPVADQGAGTRPTAGRAVALTARRCPGLADVAPTAYDGDSPAEVRRLARENRSCAGSSPATPIWSTWRCCETTLAGRYSCAICVSLLSTNAITTAEFSARMSRWCCAGCCDCARATRPPTSTVYARR